MGYISNPATFAVTYRYKTAYIHTLPQAVCSYSMLGLLLAFGQQKQTQQKEERENFHNIRAPSNAFLCVRRDCPRCFALMAPASADASRAGGQTEATEGPEGTL